MSNVKIISNFGCNLKYFLQFAGIDEEETDKYKKVNINTYLPALKKKVAQLAATLKNSNAEFIKKTLVIDVGIEVLEEENEYYGRLLKINSMVILSASKSDVKKIIEIQENKKIAFSFNSYPIGVRYEKVYYGVADNGFIVFDNAYQQNNQYQVLSSHPDVFNWSAQKFTNPKTGVIFWVIKYSSRLSRLVRVEEEGEGETIESHIEKIIDYLYKEKDAYKRPIYVIEVHVNGEFNYRARGFDNKVLKRLFEIYKESNNYYSRFVKEINFNVIQFSSNTFKNTYSAINLLNGNSEFDNDYVFIEGEEHFDFDSLDKEEKKKVLKDFEKIKSFID